jgi:hypothetical protein
MADSKRTEGERLFEQYLTSIDLPFEYEVEYAGKSKVVDYRIEWSGQPHFLEVKDFESPPLLTHGFCQVQVRDPFREHGIRVAISSK